MEKAFLFFLMSLSCTLIACAQDRNSGNYISREDSMRIKITIGDTVLTAAMADNASARDFISMMHFSLNMTDYNRIEKVSNLPRQLNTAGMPAGYDPSIGDITFYAPWGNIAIFYGDFGYVRGLVFLGRIDSGIEAFAVPGSLTARFEVMP